MPFLNPHFCLRCISFLFSLSPGGSFSRVTQPQSSCAVPKEHVSQLSNDFFVFAYSRRSRQSHVCARITRFAPLFSGCPKPPSHTHILIPPICHISHIHPIFSPMYNHHISHIVLLSHLSLLHRIGSVLSLSPTYIAYYTPPTYPRGMDSLFFTPISRRSHACSPGHCATIATTSRMEIKSFYTVRARDALLISTNTRHYLCCLSDISFTSPCLTSVSR